MTLQMLLLIYKLQVTNPLLVSGYHMVLLVCLSVSRIFWCRFQVPLGPGLKKTWLAKWLPVSNTADLLTQTFLAIINANLREPLLDIFVEDAIWLLSKEPPPFDDDIYCCANVISLCVVRKFCSSFEFMLSKELYRNNLNRSEAMLSTNQQFGSNQDVFLIVSMVIYYQEGRYWLFLLIKLTAEVFQWRIDKHPLGV